MNEISSGTENLEERPTRDDDAVERLLRIAGHRPPVPEWDAAVVKAAARAEWQKKVSSRARRRLVRRTGMFLAAAAVALMSVGLRFWRPVVATLESTTGPITIAGKRASSDLGTEYPLKKGTVVETGAGDASAGRAALRLAGGHSVRLDVGTSLQLVSSTVLALDHGTVYVDSGSADPSESITIRTPLGEARDIGTQFEVRYEEVAAGEAFLRVRVREGTVVLTRRDGKQHSAAEGVELIVRPDGTLTRGTISATEPAWDWVLEIAPTFDIEGRSARDLLDWVARERGWKLRFPDPKVADDASQFPWNDSAEISVLDEPVIEGLLASANLVYRLETDTMIVERP